MVNSLFSPYHTKKIYTLLVHIQLLNYKPVSDLSTDNFPSCYVWEASHNAAEFL